MSETTGGHSLVVSYETLTADEVAEGIDPHDRSLLEVDIVCHGSTPECITWFPCDDAEHHDWRASGWHGCGVDRDAPCSCETLDEAVEEGHDEFHGVEHRIVEGDVMAASDPPRCLTAEMDSAQESAWDVAEGLEPGNYPIDVTYEGDQFVHIALLEPVADLQERAS